MKLPIATKQEVFTHSAKGGETFACKHVADAPAGTEAPYLLTMTDGVVAVLCLSCLEAAQAGHELQLVPVVPTEGRNERLGSGTKSA